MAKYEGSVPYTGFIAPADDTDTFNVTDERFNKGGYRSVINQVERLAITPERRSEGMLVKQLDTGGYWTLEGGITNNDWVEPEFATGASEDLRWNGGSTGLDAATGRASLGLGTAATLNVGTSAGNVMEVGAFGLGTIVSTIPNLDVDIPTGFYRYAANSITGTPPERLAYGHTALLNYYQTGLQTGIFQRVASSASGVKAWIGSRTSAGAFNYQELYHTGNLTNPIQGTGSANYIPKFTNGSTLNNSLIYEVNNGIAIGKTTVTTGYTLDVNGATAMTGLKVGTLSGLTRMNGGVMEAASITISSSEPSTSGRLNGDIWVKS